MMDGTAVRALAEEFAAPVSILEGSPNSAIVIPERWKRLAPDVPTVVPLQVSKLSSLRDYLERNTDLLDKSRLVMIVESPELVKLYGELGSLQVRFRRLEYMRAVAELPEFKFGQYYPAEEFMIALQTRFVQTTARDELLTLVSGISESAVLEARDDGFAQEVNVAKGVHLQGRQKLPNPVTLKPFRTFPEIEQVESKFVLRAKSGAATAEQPLLALFEADGGAWRMQAIEAIGAWLKSTLADVAIVS